MSVSDPALPRVPVRIDLGGPARQTGGMMSRVRAQLEHLFPPSSFPMHLGYGAPPPDHRPVEAWRVVPHRGSPRALVPVNPAAARSSLLSHNRLRSPAVAATRALAAAAVEPLAIIRGGRDVLVLSVPREVDEAAVDAEVVTRHLRTRLPGTVATAVSLRDFHPQAKPTVQLVGARGEVLAFAKVAADTATGRRVRVEADLLEALAPALDRPGTPVRVPKLLDRGECGPFTYSVVEPLPTDVRGAEMGDRDAVLRGLVALSAALGPPGRQALNRTSLWREAMQRVDAAQAARDQRPDLVIGLNQLVETARETDGALPVPVGAYHGDWVPWNMCWSGSTLWVWDLEYGSRTGPLGLDALRWVFQVEHVLHRRCLTAAVRSMCEAAPQLLPRLGIAADLALPLVRLHLVDTMATALTLLAGGRGLPERLDPDALDVVQALRLPEAV